jgi:hypothetical protein
MTSCPKCGKTEHLNEYVGMCEWCYNDPKRSRYYANGSYVMQEIPGNKIVLAETIHGTPDAEMIADALNAWRTRHE